MEEFLLVTKMWEKPDTAVGVIQEYWFVICFCFLFVIYFYFLIRIFTK